MGSSRNYGTHIFLPNQKLSLPSLNCLKFLSSFVITFFTSNPQLFFNILNYNYFTSLIFLFSSFIFIFRASHSFFVYIRFKSLFNLIVLTLLHDSCCTSSSICFLVYIRDLFMYLAFLLPYNLTKSALNLCVLLLLLSTEFFIFIYS